MLEIYTAGFLDADGSVRLARHDSKSPEHTRYPQVEFYNCDKAILEHIQDRWGGRLKTRRLKSNTHNVSYTLVLNYDEAYKLLQDVLPHMIHSKKKQRTKLIVEHYKKLTPRNGKYNFELLDKKLAFVEEVMSIVMRGEGAY